jgi:hypothetical protein
LETSAQLLLDTPALVVRDVVANMSTSFNVQQD